MAVIVYLLVSNGARAEGSFATDDVMPLLQQNPALYQFVTETFDLDSQGLAIRIGSNVSEGLGGASIAPYSLRVKKKGVAD